MNTTADSPHRRGPSRRLDRRPGEPDPTRVPAPALLRLRRRLTRRLEREVDAVTGPAPDELRRYEAGYRRATAATPRPAPIAEILEHAVTHPLVFLGDYHTHPPAQAFAAELLEALAARHPEVVLLVELALSSHQAHLDRWVEGRIDEPELLRRLDYRRTWGFDFAGYRPLFLAARRLGIRLVGINGPGQAARAGLAERDRHAARVIAATAGAAPRARLLVLAGDLHVAPGHLPRQTRLALAARGIERQALLILQNPDRPYWRLLASGAEPEAAWLGPGLAAVFRGTPWARVDSFRAWIETGRGVCTGGGPADGWAAADCADRIGELVELLAAWLGVPVPPAAVAIHAGAAAAPRAALAAAGIAAERVGLALAHGVLPVPEDGALWLARTDFGHAAEAAATLLASGLVPAAPVAGGIDGLFDRVARRAVVRALRLVLEPERSGRETAIPAAARGLVALHAASVARALATGDDPGLPLAAADDLRLAGLVARRAGDAAGDRLYAVIAGDLRGPRRLRELLRALAAAPGPRTALAALYGGGPAPAGASSEVSATSSAPG